MKFSEFVSEVYDDNMFKGFEGNTPSGNSFKMQINDNNKFVPGYFIDIDLVVKDKKAWVKINEKITRAAVETLKGKKFDAQTAAREIKIVLTRNHSPFVEFIKKEMGTQIKKLEIEVWKD